MRACVNKSACGKIHAVHVQECYSHKLRAQHTQKVHVCFLPSRLPFTCRVVRVVPEKGSHALAAANERVIELRQLGHVDTDVAGLGLCQLKGHELNLGPLAKVFEEEGKGGGDAIAT